MITLQTEGSGLAVGPVPSMIISVSDAFDVSPAGLRISAREHAATAAAAQELAAALFAIDLVAGDLGSAPAVQGFVTAALTARDTQAQRATREHERRLELAERVGATAGLAERLLVDTEAIARSAVPSARFGGDSFADRMVGYVVPTTD